MDRKLIHPCKLNKINSEAWLGWLQTSSVGLRCSK